MDRKYPRAKWHEYNGGVYFVTVVTANRQNFFGKIIYGEILRTELGSILSRTIEQCYKHYNDVKVDCHTVMPNHFHAIISISRSPVGSRHAAAPDTIPTSTPLPNPGCLRPPRHPEESDNFSARNHHNARLSAVIGGIKSAVKRYANQRGIVFGWQANFHDHIIRNQRAYDLIAEYIRTNPQRWDTDLFCQNNQYETSI